MLPPPLIVLVIIPADEAISARIGKELREKRYISIDKQSDARCVNI